MYMCQAMKPGGNKKKENELKKEFREKIKNE